jgi:DNA-binding transcriptional regulator LsrR (DeoR family)
MPVETDEIRTAARIVSTAKREERAAAILAAAR